MMVDKITRKRRALEEVMDAALVWKRKEGKV